MPEEPACAAADRLLAALQPTAESERRRQAVLEYVIKCLNTHVRLRDAHCCATGSFALKTYLPESDIDITLLLSRAGRARARGGGSTADGPVDGTRRDQADQADGSDAAGASPPSDDQNNDVTDTGADDDEWVMSVTDALCRAATARRAPLRARGPLSRQPSAEAAAAAPPLPLPTIRNVEFINGRTRLVRCVVDNLTIDVTAGQRNSVGAAMLLHQADDVLRPRPRTHRLAAPGELPSPPHPHLLKRSILLIKAWCRNEVAASLMASSPPCPSDSPSLSRSNTNERDGTTPRYSSLSSSLCSSLRLGLPLRRWGRTAGSRDGDGRGERRRPFVLRAERDGPRTLL